MTDISSSAFNSYLNPSSHHEQQVSSAFQKGANESLLPEVFSDETFPPEFLEKYTLPDEFGEIGTMNANFLQEDWGQDILPLFQGFNLHGIEVAVDPFFLSEPIVKYERSPSSKMAGLPRFGFDKDVTVLGVYMADDGHSEATEYVVGLAIVSGFMLAIYLVWGVVLCILSCCTSGTLGGRPFVQSSSEKRDPGMWARIVSFIAGILLMVFAIFFVVMGTRKIQDTSTSIETASVSVRQLLMEATHVSTLLRTLSDVASTVQERLETQYEDPCPAFVSFESSQGVVSFDSSELGSAMNDALFGAMEGLENVQMDVGKAVQVLLEGIVNAKNGLDKCDAFIEESEGYELLGQLIALPFLVLTGLLLVGVIAAGRRVMPKWFECILSWVILPLFVAFTIISIVLCSVMLMSAAANADFCGGDESPDQNVLDFLIKSETLSPDEFMYKAAKYYTFQCTHSLSSEDALLEMRNYAGQVERWDQVVKEFIDGMKGNMTDSLSSLCKKDFEPVLETVEQVRSVMDSARGVAKAAFAMTDCGRLSTVYAEFVYEGTCTHSIEGFTWAFSCLVIVSFMGMIMITLRSSYQNTRFVEDECAENQGDASPECDEKAADGVATSISDISMNDITDNQSSKELECEVVPAYMDDTEPVKVGENEIERQGVYQEGIADQGRKEASRGARRNKSRDATRKSDKVRKLG